MAQSTDDPALLVARERQVRRMHLAIIRSTTPDLDPSDPDDYLLAQYAAGRSLAEAIVDTIREQTS